MFTLRTLASSAAGHVRSAAAIVRRRAGRHALRAWASVRRAWRLSLQLRITTITLVLSAALVGAFGVTVAKRITDQLLDDKIQHAGGLVTNGADWASGQLNTVTQPLDPGLDSLLETVLARLAQEAGEGVVLAAVQGEPVRAVSTYPDTGAITPPVSPELRETITEQPQRAYQIRTVDLGSGERRYLIFGTPVRMSWGYIELYYFFPLDREAKVAGQMRTTVAVTGGALVLLLVAVAGLVTRLVVRPVRVAARTAQRLSAGLLDQRMEVRGEDELALLAASFNQMATNLQRHIHRLEEMSRLQRRFTSDVSHELRTPLTTVRMAADLIFAERDSFDPAVARSAELLQRELDRFESLLTDLLEISRFDAGFAVLDAEPADLVGIVRRVAERLSSLAARTGSEIQLVLPEHPVIAEVDARRVERILRNLVGNAVEHGEHRPVRVTLAADEGAVAVTVRDYGIGLQPGEEKVVFNRFWRSDPSRARQTGGTGLGLSISLEDARLHGGWLEAWGAPGQGAQFRLTLPLRPGDRLVSSPLRLVPDDARVAAPPGPRTAEPAELVETITEVGNA
ncbi:MAG: MtrAB system histidine kinase MtrB [Micromonosporaceae bacterium]